MKQAYRVRTHRLFLILAFVLCMPSVNDAQTNFSAILFDNRKAETAGNADWIIDADLHNLNFPTSGTIGTTGTESNAQRIPLPAQTGITATTTETYWNGALSALAVDMVKKGYRVESLPYNAPLTFGNSGNAQDLSNYNVYVVCEPNIRFTAAEKTAILNFVKSGGGLFMVSDHSVSDRNNDGWDSPKIWNDLMQNNTVQANPFGIEFDTTAAGGNFSGTFTAISSDAKDSMLHGPGGNVTAMQFANGTRMTLDPSANATVSGDVFKSSSSNVSINALMAHAHFFKGKVAAIGDSSPLDDGTGDSNDMLYDGYVGDAAGNHQKLLINTMIWLATSSSIATAVKEQSPNDYTVVIYPNPANDAINIVATTSIHSVEIISYLGAHMNATVRDSAIDIHTLRKGGYILRVLTDNGIINKSFIKVD
jgi:hypothetical protein